MFIFNKGQPVALLLAEYGGAEGPKGLRPDDPRLVPLQSLVQQRGGKLDEFDHQHLLAQFSSADKAVEAARDLHLALISTDPPTSPVHMTLHAGTESAGKNTAKAALIAVLRNMAGLADPLALLVSEEARRQLPPALQ